MASRTGGVVQDQNLNIHYNEASAGWKTNVSKAPRKGGLGGRMPLGDLSNSLKPSLNQKTSKKQNSGIFSSTQKETCASQAALTAAKKKGTSKTAEKGHTGSRKPLSDISNSGKPELSEASKKNYPAKLSVLAEEPSPPVAIAEEQFLHNHQECIKAQARAMNVEQFLEIVGLKNDSSKQLASPQAHPPSAKVQSPSRNLELEEISEQLIDYQSYELNSPPINKIPTSPKHYPNWKDYENINFMLIESP